MTMTITMTMTYDPWMMRAGGALGLLLAGCTGGPEGGPGGPSADFELASEADVTLVPVVHSIPLGLWFTPMALDIGDFDGDDATDLLVAGVEPGVGVTAAIYLGDGEGDFAPPQETGFTACSAFPVTGDIDGDGRTDVVALGCSSNLAVFTGQPDGTLAPWAVWPDAEYTPVSSSIIADFEGDGDSDLMTLRIPDSAYVDVALGNGGNGIWKVETTEIGDPTWSGFDPGGMAMGHFDGDRMLDAVLIEREHDLVSLMAVPPAGFAFPTELGVDIPPWSNRVADLDDDGFDDLVISSYTSPSVQVLVASGIGDFIPGEPYELAGFAPYDTALGDIDGDGQIDVAMVDDAVPQLRWFRGSGDGRLDDLETVALPAAAIRIHAARIDDDDIDDLVTATFDDDSITLVLSNG